MLVIPVLTSFVHMEHWVFAPFQLDFDAISGSLDSCTINSCQQVQNDVQVLSDTQQQGQSLSWQRKPVNCLVHLESQCTKAWDKLRLFIYPHFRIILKLVSVLILLLVCCLCNLMLKLQNSLQGFWERSQCSPCRSCSRGLEKAAWSLGLTSGKGLGRQLCRETNSPWCLKGTKSFPVSSG